MSDYTDARSKAGLKIGGTDERELFMRNFGELTMQAWEESYDFNDATYVRNIGAGKSDTFPIIGRKRDAVEHIPGERLKGGTVEHNEIEITLDAMLVESAFIAEIDELMAHYPLSQPYARQIGESLASASNRRVGAVMVNASRETVAPYTGGPLPSYHYHANMLTDPAHLEEAAYKGVEHIRTYDIGGGQPRYLLPHQQYLLLARYTGIDTVDTSGSGNRSSGTVGQIAGLSVKGSNSVPKTNITSAHDNRSKYQGDFSMTVGVIGNQMAVGTLRRRGLRVTMDHQNDRLGTLMIGSKLEGHGKLRCECAFEVRTTTR
jgi:hypothetical protein